MKLISKYCLLLCCALALFNNIHAQDTKQEQDLKAIKSMCGCHEVAFNFAETFNYSEDSTYQASAVKRVGGLEWVQLVEDEDDKIVLQHILLAGSEDKPYVIKHWRQDWLFENRDFYMFHADKHWKYMEKPKAEVAGQWTQKVYQVDDSPRYEGSATWVHVDGKSYWENTTDAPLPRREYTKRSDYNVTVRTNRHEVTDYGWIHDQDNLKVVREEDEEDFVLAEEKGYNKYMKVDNTRCAAAQEWWKENAEMWQAVRESWDVVFAKNTDLSLKAKVEGKRLYEHLFGFEPDTKPKAVKQVINSFVMK